MTAKIENKTPVQPSEVPASKEEPAAKSARDNTLVLAAALECLILLGGLSWAMQASNGAPRFSHILLVAAIAVLCGGAFALAAILRIRAKR
jgi:hypothetical protein